MEGTTPILISSGLLIRGHHYPCCFLWFQVQDPCARLRICPLLLPTTTSDFCHAATFDLVSAYRSRAWGFGRRNRSIFLKWPWVKIQIVPSVNIPIPTKIGSKMGGAPTPTWDPIAFDPQPTVTRPPIARGSTVVPIGTGPRGLKYTD